MMREAFLSPSKRHFDRSCGVVIVLVRYTRAPSITQTSVSVPPLSMLMSRFASPDVSSAIAVRSSSFQFTAAPPDVTQGDLVGSALVYIRRKTPLLGTVRVPGGRDPTLMGSFDRVLARRRDG